MFLQPLVFHGIIICLKFRTPKLLQHSYLKGSEWYFFKEKPNKKFCYESKAYILQIRGLPPQDIDAQTFT